MEEEKIEQPHYQPPYPNPSQQKSTEISVSSGFKFVIGGCLALVVVGAVIVVGLGLLGAIPLTFVGSKPPSNTTLRNDSSSSPSTAESKNSEKPKVTEEMVAYFSALSKEEKLQKRIAGVESGIKGLKESLEQKGITCSSALTGKNQDVIIITIPTLRNASKEAARKFVDAFLEGFPGDEETIKLMVALEYVAVVITDGKRSWAKDLKSGDLIEREAK